jgi:hypothetical protein
MNACINPDPIEPTPAQDGSERQRFGRVEAYYSHSDSATQNKGGALVRVMCDSEAVSRTREFVRFAGTVAKYAYAASATCWFDIAQAYPDMVRELNDVRIVLGEDIHVDIAQAYPDMVRELNDVRIALGEDIHVTKVVVLKV